MVEPTVRHTENGTPFPGLVQALQHRIASVDSGSETAAQIWLRKVLDMTPLQTHDIVTGGLPAYLAREMVDAFVMVDRALLLTAIGLSARTLVRGRDESRLLDSNATDRLIRLAAITEQAIDVLGSKDAAERWLATPAIGLDHRRPIDLLQSSEGAELVKTLLTRMDYGVYA